MAVATVAGLLLISDFIAVVCGVVHDARLAVRASVKMRKRGRMVVSPLGLTLATNSGTADRHAGRENRRPLSSHESHTLGVDGIFDNRRPSAEPLIRAA
jgi:hypothetical protein